MKAMPIIDTHIHLFDRPFALAFNADHIKSGPAGEVTQYENFRRTHDISQAFVICYEYRPNPRNNDYVLNLAKRRNWILPFGFLRSNPTTMARQAEKLLKKNFFGLTFYPDSTDAVWHTKSTRWMAERKMHDFWALMEEQEVPVSINMSHRNIPTLLKALERYPNCILLLAHMAFPVVKNEKLNKAFLITKELKNYPNVFVKLSGFYDLSAKGWKYPQDDMFSAVDFLRDHFTAKRLLFASDAAPVLPFNTMKQTVEMLRSEYPGFTKKEIQDIYYNNAAKIIRRRQG
jgi:L-fuconolactonase